jgi:hypothetical protein
VTPYFVSLLIRKSSFIIKKESEEKIWRNTARRKKYNGFEKCRYIYRLSASICTENFHRFQVIEKDFWKRKMVGLTQRKESLTRQVLSQYVKGDTSLKREEDMEDDELDELIEWTNALNFDDYHDNWFTLATAGLPKGKHAPII